MCGVEYGSWCSALVAVVACAVVCCVVDNRIGAEGCAALARAFEGGAFLQLSCIDLAGMYFGMSVLEGLVV